MLLAVYCAHVCTMSINGVAEAFVTATASPAELNRLSRAMVVFAVIYLLLAAAGLHLAGSIGLVLANCLNMAGRITYAFAFVNRASSASIKKSKSSGGGSKWKKVHYMGADGQQVGPVRSLAEMQRLVDEVRPDRSPPLNRDGCDSPYLYENNPVCTRTCF